LCNAIRQAGVYQEMKYAVLFSLLLLTSCMHNRDVPAAKTLSGQEVRTGCLTETNQGEFVLADSKTGEKIAVTGNPVLGMHSANHAVRIVGMMGTESGASGFRAMQVDHLAASCKAPVPK
jgi:hypothetical protein